MTRIPAEVSPPGQFIQEEMDARGWSDVDVAERMGGETDKDRFYNLWGLRLILAVHGRNGPDASGLLLGEPMIAGLARAFDVSPEYFRNLEEAWFNHPTTRATREERRVTREAPMTARNYAILWKTDEGYILGKPFDTSDEALESAQQDYCGPFRIIQLIYDFTAPSREADPQ